MRFSIFYILTLFFLITQTGHSASDDRYCGTAAFGELGLFNLALTGDLGAYGSDIEGRVLLGGNATLHNYSIGKQIRRTTLVLNGATRHSLLRVYAGETTFRSDLGFTGGDGSAFARSPQGYDVPLLKFEYTTKYLRSLSLVMAKWGGVPAVVEGDKLMLTAAGPRENVFLINESQLANAKTIRIDVPKGSVVTVNVAGRCPTFLAGVNFELIGATQDLTLFNFISADKVVLSDMTFPFTILAPNSIVTAARTRIHGQVFVGALDGSPWIYRAPFEGCYYLDFKTGAKRICSFELWGEAGEFNVYTTGSATLTNARIGGRMAVGANASFNDVLVGVDLPTAHQSLIWRAPSRGSAMVLGGWMKFQDGRIENGTTAYGVASGYTKVERVAWDGVHHPGYGDSAEISNRMELLSLELAALAANGTVRIAPETFGPGKLELVGVHPRLNVFEVPAAHFEKVSYLIIEVPLGSTALVRVRGKKAAIQAFDFSYRGARRERVLFHFPEATQLDLSGIALRGSLLAPYAKVGFYSGRLEGHLFAGSMEGNGQLNLNPFEGCLSFCTKPNCK